MRVKIRAEIRVWAGIKALLKSKVSNSAKGRVWKIVNIETKVLLLFVKVLQAL